MVQRMTSKKEIAQNRTARNRDDALLGSVLRDWAAQDGDVGEAGQRIRNAVREMMYGFSKSATSTPDIEEIHNAAEWLRLASLNMNRAANWPENGR